MQHYGACLCKLALHTWPGAADSCSVAGPMVKAVIAVGAGKKMLKRIATRQAKVCFYNK
jgi:hypothetical protein